MTVRDTTGIPYYIGRTALSSALSYGIARQFTLMNPTNAAIGTAVFTLMTNAVDVCDDREPLKALIEATKSIFKINAWQSGIQFLSDISPFVTRAVSCVIVSKSLGLNATHTATLLMLSDAASMAVDRVFTDWGGKDGWNKNLNLVGTILLTAGASYLTSQRFKVFDPTTLAFETSLIVFLTILFTQKIDNTFQTNENIQLKNLSFSGKITRIIKNNRYPISQAILCASTMARGIPIVNSCAMLFLANFFTTTVNSNLITVRGEKGGIR